MPPLVHLDPIVEKAIATAVSEAGQGPSVANRLVAWLRELSAGHTVLDKKADVHAHFDNICEAMTFEEPDDEG